MITLSSQSNAVQVAAHLERWAASLPGAIDAGEKAVATRVLFATTEALEELIYEEPLPASYKKFGLEDRTGALLAGETVVRDDGGYLVTTENTGLAGKDPTLYAQWRHEYKKLPAPWREVGLRKAAPELPEAFNGAAARHLENAAGGT